MNYLVIEHYQNCLWHKRSLLSCWICCWAITVVVVSPPPNFFFSLSFLKTRWLTRVRHSPWIQTLSRMALEQHKSTQTASIHPARGDFDPRRERSPFSWAAVLSAPRPPRCAEKDSVGDNKTTWSSVQGNSVTFVSDTRVCCCFNQLLLYWAKVQGTFRGEGRTAWLESSTLCIAVTNSRVCKAKMDWVGFGSACISQPSVLFFIYLFILLLVLLP